MTNNDRNATDDQDLANLLNKSKKRFFCIPEQRVQEWQQNMSSPQYELVVNIIGMAEPAFVNLTNR